MSDKKVPGKPVERMRGVYVARQPIFDRKLDLYAYELLFRSGFSDFFDCADGDLASAKTIMNSFLLFGLDSITGGRMAFINFTRKLLLGETATMFPREQLAVEILETIEPDDEVIAACRRLKKAGYTIVLDDFIFKPELQRFVDMADIIKLDFRISGVRERQALIGQLGHDRIRFLAEKIETRSEFDEAMEMGFSYFQGYFFARPEIVAGRDIPGYKLNYMQILREVHKPDADFGELEEIVKRDVSITYKLLRFINSAAFGFAKKIQSIKQAISLLGLKEFRKLVSLVALSGMGDDKPEELVLTSMSRARFCELIAPRIGMKDRSSDLFLTGMFSMIDAFIDQPMEEILNDLPLSEAIKTALLGGENLYRTALETAMSYERGDWDSLGLLNKQLGLGENEFPHIFQSSIRWASRIFTV
ncbi:MAG TPA: HDOD domain-containing protein [Spirochaetota bacterium]|nr:MAG: HDOD domain protein [Spirochaetes bacterium ADurb.BinA120]HPI15790.1 HDOD domain-containing protein [Spirochaetota bacterium]